MSDLTISDAASSATKTTNASNQLSEDFSQFLTLLTTQLQNQDPLDPMDSSEFTNQLVQFSQVEQQINSNAKLDSILQMQMAGISSVGLGYVGMDVSYVSAEMNYDGTTPIDITYGLGSEASVAKINIYNEDGDLVYSGDAGKSSGQNSFTWSGTDTEGNAVDAGTYTVSVDALDANGDSMDVSSVVSGRVRGIETQNGVVYVLIGERAVPISSVINATTPETSA